MSSRMEELKSIAVDMSKGQDEGLNSETLIKRDTGDIITKTELSYKQVKAVTQLRTLAEVTGNIMINSMVDTLANAMVSKDRKSRDEFIRNNQSFRTSAEAKAQSEGLAGWLGKEV